MKVMITFAGSSKFVTRQLKISFAMLELRFENSIGPLDVCVRSVLSACCSGCDKQTKLFRKHSIMQSKSMTRPLGDFYLLSAQNSLDEESLMLVPKRQRRTRKRNRPDKYSTLKVHFQKLGRFKAP